MRDIKFRFYDGVEMNHNIIGYDFNCGGPDKNVLAVWNGKEKCIDHYCIEEGLDIMQYTGLKDKNGKEIYEGDIIQCNGNKDDLHEVSFGEFKVYDRDTEEAIDIAEGWYFKVLDNDVFSNVAPFCYPTPLNKYWINKIDIRVVGNKEENKDLLEIK